MRCATRHPRRIIARQVIGRAQVGCSGNLVATVQRSGTPALAQHRPRMFDAR